jgi:pimeloyl-ACP methyl ester carboxylesterase
MSAVTIDNDLVHYEVLGRGRPVILLHGWMTSWRYWIPSMQQLSMKYRTYALDLWGYGDSGKDPEKLSLDAHIELLDNFMDKLGISKAAFIGHSLGAAVMVRYARKRPDRVARMMLVSAPVFESESVMNPEPLTPPAGAGDGSATVMARPTALDSRIDDLAPRNPGDSATRPAPPPHSEPTVLRRPEDLDKLIEDGEFALPEPGQAFPKLSDLGPPGGQGFNPTDTQEIDVPANPLRDRLLNTNPQALLDTHLDKSTPDFDRLKTEAGKTANAALAASALSFDQVDLAYEIRRLAIPVLLLHGQNNAFLPPPSDGLATYLKGNNQAFRCEVVPEAGHFPMLSDPTNFHRVMMDFLETRNLADLVLHKERWVRKVR